MRQVNVPTRYEAYLETEQFDNIRQAVFNRDGRKCVVCGSTDILQAHHLTYRNVYNEPTQDLITLCKTCHSIFHAVDKRREAIETMYSRIDQERADEYVNEFERIRQERLADEKRVNDESAAILEEIKTEYLSKDYCKDGDMDMTAWEVLNPVIEKKCKEHGIKYWRGNKNELRAWFHYRRCELLLRCMDKGLSYEQVRSNTKFDSQWLWKWYRRDKCEAKINEEKELYKED